MLALWGMSMTARLFDRGDIPHCTEGYSQYTLMKIHKNTLSEAHGFQMLAFSQNTNSPFRWF